MQFDDFLYDTMIIRVNLLLKILLVIQKISTLLSR